jgi:MHS family proline/betaine transporter-like MFS transporter
MHQSQSLTREQKEAVGLLSIGSFLEYFDLMLYVHMAVLLNELFFPKTDPHTAALLSAVAFCSTYLLRPFGALIFGWIGDTMGRKSTVVITTGMMATSCIIMANLPTYEQIGITASWIVTICRMVQGISSMGEITGAQLFLSESIEPPERYPAVAVLAFFVALGTTAALAVASLVTSNGLNWRIAFWIGASIAMIGAVARTRLRETPEFVNAKQRMKEKVKSLGITDKAWENNAFVREAVSKTTTIALFVMDCMWPLCFYFAYIYCGQVLKTKFNCTPEQIINQNFVVSLAQLANFLLFVFVSYRVHPLQILKIKLFATLALMLVCPYILNNAPDPSYILLLQSSVIFFACDTAPATSVCYKYFPVFKRFTYVSMLYAMSRALTYFVTAFGFVYLVKYFGNYGLWVIMIPICIFYWWGLNHFQKLELMSSDTINENNL